MCTVTKELCETILKSYFSDHDFEFMDFSTKNSNDACVGLMSEVCVLKIQVQVDGQTKQVSFFIKFLPTNKNQLECVTKANCYKKESAFFGTSFSEMRSYLLYKSIPKCYLQDCESMIVLEDLTVSGYRNCTNPLGTDLKHTYVSLKALADIHAASLLYEHKIGKTLDEIYSEEILRPWFTELEDNPGFKDNFAAAVIISKVIDKYCTNYPGNIKEKGKQLLFKFSQNMQKSKKYRNVISHQDLWCNNIMYKYNETGDDVQEAVIIDFQMYGYSPPSLDVLQLIYCNTDKETRELHMDDMLKYYYRCLRHNICVHKVNPDDLLTWDEFHASMEETMPTSLCSAPLYLHTVLIPENEIHAVLCDEDKFHKYMTEDRSIVLDLMMKCDEYKNRIIIAVEDLLNYLSSH